MELTANEQCKAQVNLAAAVRRHMNDLKPGFDPQKKIRLASHESVVLNATAYHCYNPAFRRKLARKVAEQVLGGYTAKVTSAELIYCAI